MKKAIDIIRAEHRALAAVLSALKAFVDGMAEGKFAADFELLGDMIRYLTEVPDQVHHPKEDLYLFAALRKRSPEATAILDELEDEHRNIHAEWNALARALDDFRSAGMSGLAAFREAVNRYYDFQWQHVSKEESRVIPLAIDVLPPQDWAAIDSAFAANDNPWEGPAGKFRQLFTRIVTIAPAPIGVGPNAGAA
ncbi:MAG TPA: hemerythrin domain-containing protein [Casimicrobiaceae bacterium]